MNQSGQRSVAPFAVIVDAPDRGSADRAKFANAPATCALD